MRHRWLAAALLLVSASGVQAQSTDSAYVRRIHQDVDSISKDNGRPLYTKRAQARINARADSILLNKSVDTVVRVDTVRKVDTVFVTKPDTTVPPDTTKPKPPTSIWTHPYPPKVAAYAEFPRDSVAYPVIPMTRTITVQSLQAALDTAQTGDRLLIPSKSVTDNLVGKLTPRASWVTVQGTDTSSAIRATIGGAVSAVNINAGAHHIRFLGPLTIRAATDATNAIVRSNNGETTASQLAHDIILDGVTVTSDNFQIRRCVWLDGIRMMVVRSNLLNCSNRSGDAQGILNSQGGPYRYQGNYIEGSHQCFMSGGTDPTIPGDAASDVYFADNYCYKPLRWKGVFPYPGDQRQTKTALETKSIRRALFERNVFRNVWADAQAGFGALLKSENPGGDPLAQSKDITLRYNLFDSTASGINIAAHPSPLPVINAARITAYDNVSTHLSTAPDNGICYQLLDAVSDIVLMHNTCTDASLKAVSFDGAPGIRTVFDANIMASGQYGVHGPMAGAGKGSIQQWVLSGGGAWTNNVVVTSDCSAYVGTSTTCTLPAPPGVGADTTKVPH